jgi:hypothetical protein
LYIFGEDGGRDVTCHTSSGCCIFGQSPLSLERNHIFGEANVQQHVSNSSAAWRDTTVDVLTDDVLITRPGT